MMYNVSIKTNILDTLNTRVSSIINSNISLLNEGYIPNKREKTKLDWSSILIHAYENLEILNDEQQSKLDILFNKIITL